MRLQGFLIRVGSLALGGMVVAGCLPAAAQNVTTTPETGVTPNTLLLYRADFLPGKEEAYQQTEADIVQGYAGAKIPIYWSALQAVTGPPHVLYFDGFDNFGDIEKALADLVSASRTTLAFRRDDLGYRLNKIDLAKANYVRVSIFQFRAGYEDEFSEAVRTRARMYETNDIDTPWMFYQVHSGFSLPTYIEFQPMNSLSEIDDALERNAKARRPGGAGSLSAQKWIREADLSIDIQIYRVSQSMSHESAMEAAEAGAKRDSAPTARARKYTLRVKP